MKRIYLIILLIGIKFSFAQTNTFPTNGNTGIGTALPTVKLHVNSDNPGWGYYNWYAGNFGGLEGNRVVIGILEGKATIGGHTNSLNGWANLSLNPEGGNVGIGTSSPTSFLQVAGITEVRSKVLSDGFISFNPGGPTSQGYINWWKPGNSRVAYMGYNDGAGYNNLGLTLEAANFIINGGNVGIGTADPKGYKLAVNGKIRTQEIKVESADWPDYVFAKDYQFPTLEETEKHISEKGHLPGIPSAAEVKANGIDLGEMNAKLLQKIEELTLHLIEMKKENDSQRKAIEDRDKRFQTAIDDLKSKIRR